MTTFRRSLSLILPLVAAALGVAVGGCAQPDRVAVRPVVPSRIFVPTQVPAQSDAANQARVVLHRDNGIYGGGCSARVLMDGQLLAQVEQGEQVTLPVVAGNHQLVLSPFGACSADKQELSASIGAGSQARYDIAANGRSMHVASNVSTAAPAKPVQSS